MKTQLLLLCLLLSSFVAQGCGGDNNSTNNGGSNNGGGDTSFECKHEGEGDEICSSGKDYCLVELYNNQNLSEIGCSPLPTTCSDCECAIQAAIDSFDGANNCDRSQACSIVNGAITVTCTNVGF